MPAKPSQQDRTEENPHAELAALIQESDHLLQRLDEIRKRLSELVDSLAKARGDGAIKTDGAQDETVDGTRDGTFKLDGA
jgi:hypothetical protein